jgi:hypothetical protein
LAAAELAKKAEFASDRTTMIAAWHKHTSSIYRYADEDLAKQLFFNRFETQIHNISQQRQQRSKKVPRSPRLTPFQQALTALPLLIESRPQDEIREAVDNQAVADLASSALEEVRIKRKAT